MSIENLASQGIRQVLCDLFHERVQKRLAVCDDSVYDDLFSLFARIRLHWYARKKNSVFLETAGVHKARQQAKRLSM